MRWECRHSSAEVLYLEILGYEVLEYFDHHPDSPTRWSFAEVLDGDLDAKVRMLFGDEALAELKAAVAAADG